MFMSDLQFKALNKVMPKGMTVERVLAMDILHKDANDKFYTTKVSSRVVDCGSDEYTDLFTDEWDWNEDLRFQKLLEIENLKKDDIDVYTSFYIDIYDGYTEETIRHWYFAWTLKEDNN